MITLIGHQRIKDQLQSMFESNRLPHALLFLGPDQVGKFDLARWLATQVNQDHALDIERGSSHLVTTVGDLWQKDGLEDWSMIRKTSNFDQVHRTGKGAAPKRTDTIGREDVVSFSARIWQKIRPQDKQFCIIRDCGRLTIAAANTLLKILEEPPQNTIFLLTARSSSDVLPTILSRCAVMRVPFVARTDIEEYLQKNSDLDSENQQKMLKMLAGRGAQVVSMLEEENAWAQEKKSWQDARGILTSDLITHLQGAEKRAKELGSQELVTFFNYLQRIAYTEWKNSGDVVFLKKAKAAIRAGKLIRQNINKRLVCEEFAFACSSKVPAS